MKILLLTSCMFLLPLFGKAQYRYDMLLKSYPKEKPVRKPGADTCEKFSVLINHLLAQEQAARKSGEDDDETARHIRDILYLRPSRPGKYQLAKSQMEMISIADSISFFSIKAFADKYGLPQINRGNFPDSAIANELAFKFYTLSIHLSDRYGPGMMELFEQAIQKNMCNETDLLNYLITYLWRNTEFDRRPGDYFIVPLPDPNKSTYAHIYLEAITLFINQHVRTSKNNVQCMVFGNYYAQSWSQFLANTQSINNRLAQTGCTLSYVNPATLISYLNGIMRQYPVAKTVWQQPENKYYLVCSNLSLQFSPLQAFINTQ